MGDVIMTREANWKVYAIMFVVYSVLGSIGEHFLYWASQFIGNPLAKDRSSKVNGKGKLTANPIMEGFPLYGIGAYVAIGIKRVIEAYEAKSGTKIGVVLEFITYAVVIGLLELLAGLAVGAGPTKRNHDGNGNVKYWDYSMNHLNYKGIIDIWHILIFASFAFIVVRIHPYLISYVNKMFISDHDTRTGSESSD
jgi:hypothetical protein